MKKTVIYIILSGWMFAGCGTYSRYHRPDLSTENLYRDVPADIDTTTIASLSWREMFTDPKLQSLIETGLERNTDLNVARLRVEATEAVLMTARLSYLPSLGLTAEGNANKHDGATAKTYNVGASASWELDIFGKLTAAKRGAAAALQGSRAYRQAVQTQLVATIADSYYTLAMLDAQMAISNRTLENWRTTVRTLEALKKVGKSNEAGVLQAKANVMRLEASLLSIRKSISGPYEILSKRLGDLKGRGVALKEGQTLLDLYEERSVLYEKYADIVIDEEGKNAGETVDELRNIIEGMMDQKMIQMFIDEQKRKLEERDRLLSEKDEEIRQLKARIAQLEGK